MVVDVVPRSLGSDHDHVAAVDLAELGEPSDPVTGGEVVHEEPVVLRHRLGRVTTRPAEVERVEGRGRDPAVPVGEGQLDGAVAES